MFFSVPLMTEILLFLQNLCMNICYTEENEVIFFFFCQVLYIIILAFVADTLDEMDV